MNIRVYKVRFDSCADELNAEYDRFSEHEKQNIADLDAESFFDYHDHNDNYICYIICKPIEIKKYSGILINNLVHHDLTDLTDDILNFSIDLEQELKPLLSTVNSIKYSFFVDDLNSWILQNLDIDKVLDRILEVGITNLTDIEKDFLKNYHI